MLEKLVNKRRIVGIILAGILLVSWLLYMLFGSGEDKVMLLILTPIVTVIFYGFLRLLFKVIRINASLAIMKLFVWFFLIVGAIIIFMTSVEFVSSFPNGFSPTLGASVGVIAAMLTEAKKNIDEEKSK